MAKNSSLSASPRLTLRIKFDRRKEAGDDPVKQIQLAYRIALTRSPDETELALGTDLLGSQSLVDLTHVLLNLNEFLYMR